jgi:hypothetical protein
MSAARRKRRALNFTRWRYPSQALVVFRQIFEPLIYLRLVVLHQVEPPASKYCGLWKV